MVAVEYADQLAVSQPHGVIEVTRLGVTVVFPGDVANAHRRGEGAELGSLAIVQHIDTHAIRRVIDVLGGQHRVPHHLETLVIGGDVDVHRRPARRIRRHRPDRPLQRPGDLEVPQHQDHPGVALGGQQTVAEHRLDLGIEHQRLAQTPIQVAGRDQHRQQHHRLAYPATTKASQHQQRQHADTGEHQLALQGQRRGDKQSSQGRPQDQRQQTRAQ